MSRSIYSESVSRDTQTTSQSSSAAHRQIHTVMFRKTTAVSWSSHHYAQEPDIQTLLNTSEKEEGKCLFGEHQKKKVSVEKQAGIQLLKSYSQVKIYSLRAQELPGKHNLVKPAYFHHIFSSGDFYSHNRALIN